jgi:hypothetical protein
MDDAAAMGHMHRLGQGSDDLSRLAGWLGLPRDFLGEIAAYQKFHREIGLALDISRVEDLDDIWMANAGDRFRFSQESRQLLRSRVHPVQDHLEGNRPVRYQDALNASDTSAVMKLYADVSNGQAVVHFAGDRPARPILVDAGQRPCWDRSVA